MNHHSDVESINFGFGESFLEVQFLSLLADINSLSPRIGISITSNGTIANILKGPDRNLNIIASTVREIDISLDYADETLHDRSRGFAGAYNLALGALSRLRDLGIYSSIVVVGNAETMSIDNLSRLIDIAKNTRARLRVNIMRSESLPEKSEVLAVWRGLEFVTHASTAYLASDPILSAFSHAAPELEARESFRIMPDGRLTPSTYLLDPEWTICTLDEIIGAASLNVVRSAQSYMRYHTPLLTDYCTDCHQLAACRGGSADRRFLISSRADAVDPYCPRRVSHFPRFADRPTMGISIHSRYLPTISFEF